MYFYNKFYYRLLNFIGFLIKSKSITSNISFSGINFNHKNNTIYLLRYHSKIDLLVLRKKCLENNLPDPLDSLNIKNIIFPRYFYLGEEKKNSSVLTKIKLERFLTKYISLQLKHNDIHLEICLISIFFGRSPDKFPKNNYITNFFKLFKHIKKFFYLSFFKRDMFIHFSNTIYLHEIILQNKKNIFIKLFRTANIYFIRQKLIVSGPPKISKKKLFQRLFKIKIIDKSIKNESKIKNISYLKAKNNTAKIIKEIAANFSYTMLRITERIMSYILKKLYRGINVKGSEKIINISRYGNKIVYLPCHRSHMDYLLLSYVIYNHGVVPPHIVSGINLSFWPAGFIFRNLGAFFIRRSFKGNKLYTNIFKEYLIDLFNRGHSIECFIEGSRSRTGKLLKPKTGTLSITLQSIIQGNNKSIVLLPVYIGYENIIEENTYVKELQGAAKQKEGLIQTFKSLLKLRNFGEVYVNFGEPLYIIKYLKKYVPQYSNIKTNKLDFYKPSLSTIVNDLSKQIMIRINNACAVNAINLCSIVLLSSDNNTITCTELIYYLNFYVQLLNHVPYSTELTIPNVSAEILLEKILKMHKFIVCSKKKTIFLSKKQLLLMRYYRNNIYHTLALPSLIASIIYQNNNILKEDLFKLVLLIYPFIKEELFLHWEKKKEVLETANNIVLELERQQIIIIKKTQICIISSNIKSINTLKILSSILQDFFKKYTTIFLILYKYSIIHRVFLEKKMRYIYSSIFVSSKYDIQESFNKSDFLSIFTILKNEGYIIDGDHLIIKKSKNTYHVLFNLITNKKTRIQLNKIFSN